MALCLLSYQEARQLERDGTIPDCRVHSHIPAKKADQLVAEGAHRFVGDRNVRIAPCMPKEWTGANSAFVRVMEMRPVWRDKKRQAGRNGIAAGKHRAPACRILRDTSAEVHAS